MTRLVRGNARTIVRLSLISWLCYVLSLIDWIAHILSYICWLWHSCIASLVCSGDWGISGILCCSIGWECLILRQSFINLSALIFRTIGCSSVTAIVRCSNICCIARLIHRFSLVSGHVLRLCCLILSRIINCGVLSWIGYRRILCWICSIRCCIVCCGILRLISHSGIWRLITWCCILRCITHCCILSWISDRCVLGRIRCCSIFRGIGSCYILRRIRYCCILHRIRYCCILRRIRCCSILSYIACCRILRCISDCRILCRICWSRVFSRISGRIITCCILCRSLIRSILSCVRWCCILSWICLCWILSRILSSPILGWVGICGILLSLIFDSRILSRILSLILKGGILHRLRWNNRSWISIVLKNCPSTVDYKGIVILSFFGNVKRINLLVNEPIKITLNDSHWFIRSIISWRGCRILSGISGQRLWLNRFGSCVVLNYSTSVV